MKFADQRVLLLLLALIAGPVIFGCGAPDSGVVRDGATGQQATGQAGPTLGSNVDVDDPHAGSGLRAVAQASDLVVRATVVKTTDGVELSGDTSVRNRVVTLEVAQVLLGSSPGSSIDVALMSEINGALARVDGLPLPATGDDAIWMLTRVDGEFGFDGYVVTSTGSLLMVDDEGKIANQGEAASLREANALGSVRAVESRIRGK